MVGRTSCSGDLVLISLKTRPSSRSVYRRPQERDMGLLTLQHIFEMGYPDYEHAQPLPAHVRKAARHPAVAYSSPSHSTYTPMARCWGILEHYWQSYRGVVRSP